MESFPDRAVDACLNRASEGLRVLMDLARFGLEQADFSARLKDLRHELIRTLASTKVSSAALTAARDSLADVGRPTDSSDPNPPYRDTYDLFEANCRRVAEALRSIEEILRLSETELSREVELIRYRVYDLQKEMSPFALAASQRAKMDFELYVVTDRPLAQGRPLEKVVAAAIRGGAGCVQLREKTAETREFLNLARSLRRLTREEGVTFIVNDSLEIALEVEADGVHLGQEDLPLDVARRLSKGGLLIGVSTHSPEQALEAQWGGAGYVNLGPIFSTSTKGRLIEGLGTGFIRETAPKLRIPFTTMGGVHLNNVEEVILAGADRVAVVSEIMAAPDPERAARETIEAIRRAKDRRDARREVETSR